MNTIVSFTKLLLLTTFFKFFYSCAFCQNDKDLLPAPKVKVGIAKLSGSMINFNYGYFVNSLLSMRNKKAVMAICENPSEAEKAYSMIDEAISLVIRELNMVA